MTDAKYMIHPVVVYCKATLSVPISRWSLPSLKLDRMAPQACVMHFGVPVVPEEYAMKNGSLNEVFSNVGSHLTLLERNCPNVCARGTLEMSAGCLNLGREIIP